MRGWVHGRQRGQTIAFAAVAIVAIVGGLAIVVDAGMFLVIQRQLQTAADAGALAGAWHDPICVAAYQAQGCLTSPATPPVLGTVVGTPPSCVAPPPVTTPPTPASCANCDGTPGFASCDVALANANTVSQLCSGPVSAIVSRGTTLIRPRNVNTIVVTVQCDAGYSFGQILNLSTKRITASAAAAIGNRDATNWPTCNNGGDMTDLDINPQPPKPPFCGFIARLIK